MMEEEPVDRPIRVIGRYALYGKLASGGMATVHFGRLLGPAGFSRTVAIKRLHPQFAKDPEFVAMFLDEARLAARIQHPNVVATVDVVAMGEELFLVMDYIRGESFSRLLRASRKKGIDVTLGTIASVLAGMLHGLHAAHEAKDEHGRALSVVHRDVSPQNVLVGVDGVTRVLDFGVAKAAARVQVTRDGQMKGKLAYMAPEQLNGKGVDRRTDIFAAGIVLWEALTGRRLFDADEAAEVLRMITTEDIPPPSAVVPSIARNIDAIVMKALARDPSRRFQTAREFAIALEDATHLGSPREVGEWVERVAGDTLLNREQAVAEIEAVSSVSEVSATTETSPGLLRTLDGARPASVPGRRPPPPKPPRRAPAPPKTIPDAAKEWEEGPTRVFDTSSPHNELVLGDSTRVHVPRPSHAEAKAPPLLPASHGFDDENEKTNVFDPKKHGFGDENEKTNVFDPKKHGFDDENEKTSMFAPTESAPPSPPAPTRRTNRRPTPPPAQRPAASRPPAIPKGASTIPKGAPAMPGGAPALPKGVPPMPQSSRTMPRAAPTIPQASIPIAPSVIVQEHTDPQMFRHRPTVVGAALTWLWDDPRHRTWRVALAAGTVAMVGAFVLVAVRGGHRDGSVRVSERLAPAASVAPPVASVVVAAKAGPPEPHGVDLSTLPREGEEPPAAQAAPPAAPAPVAPVAPPSPSPETVKASRVLARPGAPQPKAVTLDEEPASPAPAVAKPSAAPKSAPAPAAPAPPKAAAVAPAKGTKAAPDCSQPFQVDEHGIRRIKPECL